MKSNKFSNKFVSTMLGRKVDSVQEEMKVPPIKEMLKDLMGISDMVWGKYAFRREPLRGKFNEEEKAVLTQKANACGKKYAQDIRAVHGNVDMYTLAEKLGLEVDYPDKPNGGGHIIFAQFVEPNKITVFKDSVDKANDLIRVQKLANLFSNVNIEEILLAHEIFHYIEENEDNIFTRTEKIRLWKIGPMKNDSQIVCLGEIAGMAFAKEVLKLNYSPYILDSFLVYLYHPQVAYGLYQEVMKLNEA